MTNLEFTFGNGRKASTDREPFDTLCVVLKADRYVSDRTAALRRRCRELERNRWSTRLLWFGLGWYTLTILEGFL